MPAVEPTEPGKLLPSSLCSKCLLEPTRGDGFLKTLGLLGAERSRRFTLLSFQRPALRLNGVKKPLTRAEASASESELRIRLRPKASKLSRVAGTLVRRPCGQPGDDSRSQALPKRAKRRFPACSAAPSRRARGTSSSVTASP